MSDEIKLNNREGQLDEETGPRIDSYYEIITDESAANGEAESTGDNDSVSMVPDEFDEEGLDEVDKAIEYLKDNLATEFSASFFDPHGWYIHYGDRDFQTGEITNTSYHLKGFSEEQLEVIYNLMHGKGGTRAPKVDNTQRSNEILEQVYDAKGNQSIINPLKEEYKKLNPGKPLPLIFSKKIKGQATDVRMETPTEQTPMDSEIETFNFGSVISLISAELEVLVERLENLPKKTTGDGQLLTEIQNMLTNIGRVTTIPEVENIIKQHAFKIRKINSEHVRELLSTLSKIYGSIPYVMKQGVYGVLRMCKALNVKFVTAQENYTDPRVDSSQSVSVAPAGNTNDDFINNSVEDDQLMDIKSEPPEVMDMNPMCQKLDEVIGMFDEIHDKFKVEEFLSRRPTINQKLLARLVYDVLKAKNLALRLKMKYKRLKPRLPG